MIEISKIEIKAIKPKQGLVGFANIVVNGTLKLNSIAIHSKLNGEGYRLTYPTKNQFYLFHPINEATSRLIEQAVINEFKNVTNTNDRYSRTVSTAR